MALKIVTGGTTGAADGTLVSSSNKIVFTAVDTVVDAHIRSDDDTYSADASFSMPSDGAVQVSYDGGSTWKAFSDNPASYGVDIGDLNVAIKLRQHANASASTGTFSTDATTPAATALGDVTGFTVTPGNAQNALSWSAVANRTAYRIDRATDSGFTTGVALDISPGQTSTSFTNTSLTNGTTYYYRIKAVGTVRYKDSANYATGNGAPVVASYTTFIDDTMTVSSDTKITSHSPDTGGAWSLHASDTNGSGTWEPTIYAVQDELYSIGTGNSVITNATTPGSANQRLTGHFIRRGSYNTGQGWRLLVRCSGGSPITSGYAYIISNNNASGVTCTLYYITSGTFTALGPTSGAIAVSTSAITQFRLTANGTSIIAEYSTDGGSNWTQTHNVTDSHVTATDKIAFAVTDFSGAATTGINLDRIVAGYL